MNAVFNRHAHDVRAQTTIEFNVKRPIIPDTVSESCMRYEMGTAYFRDKYAQRCFNEINKPKYKWLKDWTFTGRSDGWFTLCCECDEQDIKYSRPRTLGRIETIVEKYFKAYGEELAKFYKNWGD